MSPTSPAVPAAVGTPSTDAPPALVVGELERPRRAPRSRPRRATRSVPRRRPRPAPPAEHRSSDVDLLRRGLDGPTTVVVVQPKGGTGKTPTAVCLAAAFGVHRGGGVLAWDGHETRGTMALRVADPGARALTVRDLLADLARFETATARVGDLARFVRPQPGAHFDALVSDDDPAGDTELDATDVARVHAVLQRFYRVLVVDTGTNPRAPAWQQAVRAADRVVVVSPYRADAASSATWVLDHLAGTGREALAADAVTVLTAAEPRVDPAVRADLVARFAARTGAVVEVPHDPALARGVPIRWEALAPVTRGAWTAAAAAVARPLAPDPLAARPPAGPDAPPPPRPTDPSWHPAATDHPRGRTTA